MVNFSQGVPIDPTSQKVEVTDVGPELTLSGQCSVGAGASTNVLYTNSTGATVYIRYAMLGTYVNPATSCWICVTNAADVVQTYVMHLQTDANQTQTITATNLKIAVANGYKVKAVYNANTGAGCAVVWMSTT